MRTFDIFRNECNLQGKLWEIMNDLWYDQHFEVVYPENLYNNPTEAYRAFMAFQNIAGNIGVVFHLYRMRFLPDDSEDYAITVAYNLAEGLLSGFQSIFALAQDLNDGPCIIMLVNSVSNYGVKLYDNNAVLINIMKELNRITGEPWTSETKYTLFDGSTGLQERYSDLGEVGNG